MQIYTLSCPNYKANTIWKAIYDPFLKGWVDEKQNTYEQTTSLSPKQHSEAQHVKLSK